LEILTITIGFQRYVLEPLNMLKYKASDNFYIGTEKSFRHKSKTDGKKKQPVSRARDQTRTAVQSSLRKNTLRMKVKYVSFIKHTSF